ncbi:MAG TPA: cytochrome c3 family protein [Thermoanaerobaculia bacterium]|nr:cytochrome c3 family protein [Thermoanaerobaculia bacterium]
MKAEGSRLHPSSFILHPSALLLLLSAFCLLPSSLVAKDGAYRSTAHGDPVKGPQRRTDVARGSCAQCHLDHESDSVSVLQRGSNGLFAPNDNNLCFTCHGLPSDSGAFPGSGQWMQSAHGTSSRLLRPDMARLTSNDNGKCINCHDPHGAKDSAGIVPAMLDKREPDLCLTCHDGARGADIRNQLTKSYRHGMNARGRHEAHEGDDPSRYAGLPGTNRHVACSDCHNVHRATQDRTPPTATEASSALAGVSRIEVANGIAGSAPRYTWRGPDDPGVAREYEICFKCHSSWTKLASGQSDLALLTNPQNASFHPIQAPGKNPNIDFRSFVNGVGADSQISCGDCHDSDDENVRGPHGSSNRYLLKRPATTTSMTQPMQKGDLCFACHSYDVYASAVIDTSVQRASRFNAPAGPGHTFHVSSQQIPCYACHETHGSARMPALIARGRLPGITSYIQTIGGGTCISTCHAPKTYALNYPR